MDTTQATQATNGEVRDEDDMRLELINRLTDNFSSYMDMIKTFGKAEIIDMAGKISAVEDVYTYLLDVHKFDYDELAFYLQFENPLEIIADGRRERAADISDVIFTMENILDHKELITNAYPLISDGNTKEDTGLRRFMNVNLYDFLGEIAVKTIIHYPNDWNIDKDEFQIKARSDNPEDKRLLWHVCSCGTHIVSERDSFIRDSGAYEYWTDYRQNDPDMFGYAIEITGVNSKGVFGNVFEVGNYADNAKYVRDNALRLDTLTLTYSSDYGGVNSGKSITVSRREYDDDRHRLMCESGFVKKVRFHPKDENQLTELLRKEHVARMSYPIGSQEAHLDKIGGILAEVRKPKQPEVEDKPKQPAVKPEGVKLKPKQNLSSRLREATKKARAHTAPSLNNKLKNTPKRGERE